MRMVFECHVTGRQIRNGKAGKVIPVCEGATPSGTFKGCLEKGDKEASGDSGWSHHVMICTPLPRNPRSSNARHRGRRRRYGSADYSSSISASSSTPTTASWGGSLARKKGAQVGSFNGADLTSTGSGSGSSFCWGSGSGSDGVGSC